MVLCVYIWSSTLHYICICTHPLYAIYRLCSPPFYTIFRCHCAHNLDRLARDSQLNVYVALKLHQAQNFERCNELRFLEFLGRQNPDHLENKYFPLLLHYFTINGPNSSHLCLVTTVAGPSIRDLSHLGKRLPAKEARKAAYQVTQALLCLYSLGICHGGNSQPRSFKVHMLTIIFRSYRLKCDSLAS